MRKFFLLIMAFLYLTLTSGVVVNVHYCMDRMVGVTYGSEQDHACQTCGMKQKSDCCRTEHKFVKSTLDHVGKISIEYSLIPAIAETASPVFDQASQPAIAKNKQLALYHSPPDQRSNSFAAFTSVFRV